MKEGRKKETLTEEMVKEKIGTEYKERETKEMRKKGEREEVAKKKREKR